MIYIRFTGHKGGMVRTIVKSVRYCDVGDHEIVTESFLMPAKSVKQWVDKLSKRAATAIKASEIKSNS